MKNNIREKLKLYLVTDSNILRDRDFYGSIEEAIRGGVTMVQLREKDASGKEFLEKALKLRELTRKYNIPLIINDRVDIALICDADGVHVGQSDINANYVRKLIGPDKILGVSARNIEEAKMACNDSADYIGVGAIYSTATKGDAKIVSIEAIKNIKKEINIPIVLIGGITLDKLSYLQDLYCDGYAIVSALLKKDDIYNEAKKWTNQI